MRAHRLWPVLALLLAACSTTAPKPPASAPQALDRHVLVIGIDGLRGDALACDGCAQTQALAALMRGGAYHRNLLAGGSQKTVSGPGWASVFTGFWADQHGVAGNDKTLPMLKPHVFDLIEQADPGATIAVVGDWYNITHNLLPQGADQVVANADKDSQQATDTVKGWLAQDRAPTAIFYYLHNVDVHVCCYEPRNPHYQQMIRKEDAQIQQVLDALVARPNYANEDWLIVVASDHGGLEDKHGGQSRGERAALLILNNSYGQPETHPAYCRGDLSAAPLQQIDGAAPHILGFFGLPNPTAGRTHPACGRAR